MKGIYVQNTRATKYAEAIAKAYKPLETRTRDMLGKLLGERVAIIRTGLGLPATVVGYATIVSKRWVEAGAEWEGLRDQHLIPPGSKYDCNGKGKWCYLMAAAEPCDPFPVPADRINHGRAWCEFDMNN